MKNLRRTIRISCQQELRIPPSFLLTNLHTVHHIQTEIYGNFVFFLSNFLLSLGVRQRPQEATSFPGPFPWPGCAGRAFLGEIENAEEDWREHLSLTPASSSLSYLFIIT